MGEPNTVAKSAKPERLDSVDMLRGLVMVIMALDHVRDFFHEGIHQDPTNLKTTTAALFLTRWITHYCAPTFIFLAGTGAFLSRMRGKSKAELSWFLFTRGIWCAFFEVIINNGFLWTFNLDIFHYGAGVFWAIGLSMIVLSVLIYLPMPIIAAIGIGMILFHNRLDGIRATDIAFSFQGTQYHFPRGLWMILHQPGETTLWSWQTGIGPDGNPLTKSITFGTGYLVIPWAGVMAAGYCFGEVFRLDRAIRRKWLLALGLVLIAAFIGLRYTNWYGDAKLWSEQANPVFTVLSFLNCTKYPPSLLYLLMTLGPAIFLLGLFDRPLGRWANPLITFGRVPLFYYLLHIPLIHGGIVLLDFIRFGKSPMLFDGPGAINEKAIAAGTVPAAHGVNLLAVYAIWIVVVLILYFPCRWWAGVKQRHRDWWWLSYL